MEKEREREGWRESRREGEGDTRMFRSYLQ